MAKKPAKKLKEASQVSHARKVGVFFGSRSEAHDLSVRMGRFVITELSQMGYRTVPVYVSRHGGWYVGNEYADLKWHKNNQVNELLKQKTSCSLDTSDLSHKTLKQSPSLTLHQPRFWRDRTIDIDVIFPVFLSSDNENGTLSGLAQMLGVPAIGSKPVSSAIAKDRVLTKGILTAHNIPTTKYVFFNKHEWSAYRTDLASLVEDKLGYPVLVKLGSGGDPGGVGRAGTEDGLVEVLEAAFKFDDTVLVESDSETVITLNIALTGNYFDPSEIQTSKIVQLNHKLSVNKESDNSEEADKVSGVNSDELITPAKISESVAKKIDTIAREAFQLFELSGTANITFAFNRGTGNFYLNEIDPLPVNLSHNVWSKSGVSTASLLRELVRLADQSAERDFYRSNRVSPPMIKKDNN